MNSEIIPKQYFFNWLFKCVLDTIKNGKNTCLSNFLFIKLAQISCALRKREYRHMSTGFPFPILLYYENSEKLYVDWNHINHVYVIK